MRGGSPGSRKLDFCIEVVTLMARERIEHGDQVGLLTVDGRVLSHVAPREGIGQMIALYDALLRSLDVVDEDLTAVDDGELLQTVGRYVRSQDGLDLRRLGQWDQSALVKHAQQVMRDDPEAQEAFSHDPRQATLRRFCRHRGIPLRYKATTDRGIKASGLTSALMLAGGKTRMPRSIVVLTDFDGIDELDPMVKTLSMLSARQHASVFICPDAAGFADPPADQHTEDLHLIYGLQEARRLKKSRRALGRIGVPLVSASSRDTPATVAVRASVHRRVA
jgi:uncharacterized protein (DUF58 family)